MKSSKLEIGLVAIVLVTFIVNILYYSDNIIPEGDIYTYAILARSISENGFPLHRSILPADIIALKGLPEITLNQNLGYPLLLAAGFRLIGSNLLVLHFCSLMLIVASLYNFNKLFLEITNYDKQASVYATAALACSPLFVYYAYLIPADICVFLCFCILCRILVRNEISSGDSLAGGAILAMVYITKSASFYFTFPAILIYLLFVRKIGLKKIALFLLCVLVALVAQYIIEKQSISLIQTVKSDLMDLVFNRTGISSEWYKGLRSLELPSDWFQPLTYLSNNWPNYFLQYWMTLILLVLKTFGPSFLAFIPAFAVASTFNPFFSSLNQGRHIMLMYLIYFFTLMGFAISWPLSRYLMPAAPLIFVSGAWLLQRGMAYYKLPNMKGYLIAILLFGISMIQIERVTQSTQVIKRDDIGVFHASSKQHKFELVTSNEPVLLGWHGNLNVVLLPNSVSDLFMLSEHIDIDGIVLTRKITSTVTSPLAADEWRVIFQQRPSVIGDSYCLDERANSVEIVIYYKCVG